MTAVLYDEVVAPMSAPLLRVVPDPAPVTPPPAPRPRPRFAGGDPLLDGAARLLCVPLRQLYAVLWRAGVIEVGA